MSKPYTDEQFSEDFTELTNQIAKRLREADSIEDVRTDLSMLEGLATHPNAPASAKTVYGVAYLLEDKEWYDFDKGFEWVKKGADDAGDNEPFCWFILGSIYLNGKPELPIDLISAKYWIGKAANVGYKPAICIQELQWGDNPDGFLDWFEEKMEGRKPNRIVLGLLIGVILIILVILLCKLW